MPSNRGADISWDDDVLYRVAEKIRNSITGGRLVFFDEYKALAAAVPIKQIGLSLAWILKNEGRMAHYLPAEIISAVSGRLNGRYRFDKHADYFIRTHSNMTANEIGTLLFVARSTVGHRAKRLGVKLKPERHRFSEGEDKLIKEYAATDLGRVTKTMGVTRRAAVTRAKKFGLHVPREKSIRYSEGELKTLGQADLVRESDEEIASRLDHRTANSIEHKRQRIGKLRRKVLVWRRHPKMWQYLLANYQTMSCGTIARKLRLRRSQVYKKAWHEGLKKR